VPLGQHLGANQEVDFATAKGGQDLGMCTLTTCLIGIKATYPSIGESLTNDLLKLLSAMTNRLDLW
tara:strand:+ start:930 stop:1127 length:198 start_codon:yes stop_codon:yes gene_type:complete